MVSCHHLILGQALHVLVESSHCLASPKYRSSRLRLSFVSQVCCVVASFEAELVDTRSRLLLEA